MKADFDIGNLLYVALTIVFLIIGAMGKKKKPVQRQTEESPESIPVSEDIKSQFQELFREFNPVPQDYKEEEYSFAPTESVEDGPVLDVVPDERIESVEYPAYQEYIQPLDSNINYNDQAQSSLDTTGMDEGTPAFNYQKDEGSLIYNDLTKEYTSVLSDEEEELAGIVDNFDPKSAFVYSEIFNRKEF